MASFFRGLFPVKSRTNLVRISEKEFIRQVMLAAHHNGWVVAHFGSAKTVGGRWITPIQGHAKGFPDLVMIHRKTGRLLAVELKVGRNQASKEQLDWLVADSAEHSALLPQVFGQGAGVDTGEEGDVLGLQPHQE